jgi:hypothetical protein
VTPREVAAREPALGVRHVGVARELRVRLGFPGHLRFPWKCPFPFPFPFSLSFPFLLSFPFAFPLSFAFPPPLLLTLSCSPFVLRVCHRFTLLPSGIS